MLTSQLPRAYNRGGKIVPWQVVSRPVRLGRIGVPLQPEENTLSLLAYWREIRGPEPIALCAQLVVPTFAFRLSFSRGRLFRPGRIGFGICRLAGARTGRCAPWLGPQGAVFGARTRFGAPIACSGACPEGSMFRWSDRMASDRRASSEAFSSRPSALSRQLGRLRRVGRSAGQSQGSMCSRPGETARAPGNATSASREREKPL
jgi:hypothetical protein